MLHIRRNGVHLCDCCKKIDPPVARQIMDDSPGPWQIGKDQTQLLSGLPLVLLPAGKSVLFNRETPGPWVLERPEGPHLRDLVLTWEKAEPMEIHRAILTGVDGPVEVTTAQPVSPARRWAKSVLRVDALAGTMDSKLETAGAAETLAGLIWSGISWLTGL